MDDDLERRAGKGPDDAHPVGEATDGETDPSDYADPRVAQPGDDPADEDALGPDARSADDRDR
jgi:hypothetical protein